MEKVAIVHQVLVKYDSHKDVAYQFRVKPVVISLLVKKAKKNHTFIEELLAKDEKKDQTRESVVAEAKQVLQEGHFIYNAKQIVTRVKEHHGILVDVKTVRKVFRDDLDLQYRKMKRVPFQGNSERCLVLR